LFNNTFDHSPIPAAVVGCFSLFRTTHTIINTQKEESMTSCQKKKNRSQWKVKVFYSRACVTFLHSTKERGTMPDNDTQSKLNLVLELVLG